jgi:indolepyruvate ferredoxin oxidoreductase, beta subunit
LRGFAAGVEIASGLRAAPQPALPGAKPASVEEIMAVGRARLVDYQGEKYAALYAARMRPFLDGDAGVAAAVARHLAVWMTYEDIIRVADLKTRASRFERVRKEVGAKEGEPVVVIDYMKPGIEEFASIMPEALGRRLIAWAERRGKLDAYYVGMHVKTSGLPGFLLVRALAWLKPWRPRSYRYREEQRLIERWLARILEAKDAELAREIAECAGLVKGYGETHRRGKASFLAILDTLVDDPSAGLPRKQAAALRKAREAALADPEGQALGSALGKPVVWLKPVART